ncbi:hypothetical protein LCGC14_2019930, partial [marine sediment metagenome]
FAFIRSFNRLLVVLLFFLLMAFSIILLDRAAVNRSARASYTKLKWHGALAFPGSFRYFGTPQHFGSLL